MHLRAIVFLTLATSALMTSVVQASDESDICQAIITEVSAGPSNPDIYQIEKYNKNRCEVQVGLSIEAAVSKERERLDQEYKVRLENLMRHEGG